MDHKDYRLAAIMFTDIVGFSKMMEKDEAGTIALLEYHNALVAKYTSEYKGTIIKTIGDAFLVDFSNSVNAVKCAIDIQDDLSKYNKEHPEKTLVLRIGVHLGDIYFYETDALGEGINIASRLQSLCNPGRVCISQDVHNLVANKISGPAIRELGDVKLKNISREIRAYEIMTEGMGNPPPPEKEPAGSAERSAPAQESTASKTTVDPNQPVNPAMNATGSVDVHSLKQVVLGEIKRLGRRISIDQVKGWYRGQVPEGLEDALEALAERGFISRGTTSQSAATPPRSPSGSSEYRTRGSSGSGPGSSRSSSDRSGSGELRFEFRKGYDSDKFERGLREFKEVTREIGREVMDAIRSETWFGGRKNRNELIIPDHRGDGSNENRDKQVERQWDRVLDATPRSLEDEQFIVQEYRQQTERSAEKYNRGFRAHLGSFLGVNLMLFGIWAFIAGAGFPWFLFPLGGWGIGMLSHLGGARRRQREAAEIKALPGLNKQQLKTLRKLHRARDGWGGHAIGTIATSAFLFMVNMVTSPWVPWSLIPIGAMSIGLFTHYPVFKGKERDHLLTLRDQGVPIGLLTSGKQRKKLLGSMANLPSEATPTEIEAARLKGAIEAQLKSFEPHNPLGDDFPELLEDYIKQISDLSRKLVEIDGLVRDIPRADLERDLASLESQKEQTSNQALAAEYQKGIEQIQRQQKAFEDLDAQQKIIKLRLANAMNSLRQIQLELVRMKSLGRGKQDLPTEELRERTEHLNSYVEDLRSGYAALESEDFKELEKYKDL